jgi:dihydrofolate synthase/folylpolyglutamate synthase
VLIHLLFHSLFSENIPATFFEYTTMLAISHFAEQNVDVAVVEVGLGGRLDSTNMLSPISTAVTSIGLDHTGVLGNTIELIAGEKAGIIKQGIPAVLGPHAVPRAVFMQNAVAVGAPVVQIDPVPLDSLGSPDGREVQYDYEAENNAIAKAVLRSICDGEFAESGDGGSGNAEFALKARRTKHALVKAGVEAGTVTEAIAQSSPPCRFEQLTVEVPRCSSASASASASAAPRIVSIDDAPHTDSNNFTNVDVVVDVAHNPAALDAVVRRVRHAYAGRPVRVVAGLSASKDLGNGLRPLLELCTTDEERAGAEAAPKKAAGVEGQEGGQGMAKQMRLHLVQANHPRAASVHELAAVVEAIVGGSSEELQINVHPQEEDAVAPVGTTESSVRGGVLAALRKAAARSTQGAHEEREVVLVCGTIFIMAEVRAALGIEEPRDSPYVQKVHGAHISTENARIKAAESLAAAQSAQVQ